MSFNGKYRLPTVGMRNLKTALAAALCALAYYFLDRSPAFLPASGRFSAWAPIWRTPGATGETASSER